MNAGNNHIVLNTGAPMPIIGLGTWKSAKTEVGQAVKFALTKCGYRHVDCASIYGNEKEIGESLGGIFNNGTVHRTDIFITSKLWNNAHARSAVSKACRETLADLRFDYLDLYLMHWGMAASGDGEQLDDDGNLITEKIPIRETWEAMEDLVRDGLTKAIGVANFTAPMLLDVLSYAKIPPAVNQVELHPYLQQSRLIEFCEQKGVAVTAYSPLGAPGSAEGQGLPILLEDKVVMGIARAHGKTPAQVLLRWGIQRNTIVIPKSTNEERIKENIDVFDFELSESEVEALGALDRNLRFVDPYRWYKVPYFD